MTKKATDLVAEGIFVGDSLQKVVDERRFRIFAEKGREKVHANELEVVSKATVSKLGCERGGGGGGGDRV